MTLGELNRHIIDRLTPSLGLSEARATARLLLEDDLAVTPVKLLTAADRVLEPETLPRFEGYLDRIAAGEPPQYVMGRARWMGMDLTVTPDTLIPRPETAELVDRITDDFAARDLRVADLCTGSGCIAVALARALPYARVDAVDISDGALVVARKNSSLAPAGSVNIIKADVLKGIPGDTLYDIIVSNPPYVLQSEAADMEPRVLEHEPHLALFVPDDDPLRFYRAIASQARSRLNPGGRLYFEINPLEADALSEMLSAAGFEPDVWRDSQGRRRFITASLKP
ncbi:MAG: peptide chain release factor N(5)-glutamine methyltransferase [Muribaculaceae bacterium]|nr:peptide chain release factor N(5)-glutamine methyltransferase [Muribaculaceae bacterium]